MDRMLFVVLNPVAGHSDPQVIREALERRCAHADWSCEVYETTGQEDLLQVVREALDRGADRVVAAGGDGTVSGVASGLVHTAVPMGILPVGTGNGLARALGIPTVLEEALNLLLGEHTTRSINAMRIGEDYFVLNVGIGLSSLATRDTSHQEKRRLGFIAYIWTGFLKLLGFQPRRFAVTLDQQRQRFKASEIFIVNGSLPDVSVYRWGARIELEQAQLGLFVIRARTALDYARAGWSLLRGRRADYPYVRYLSAQREIRVDVDNPLPVQADGEIIGHTPVHVQYVLSAVQVIVPASQD